MRVLRVVIVVLLAVALAVLACLVTQILRQGPSDGEIAHSEDLLESVEAEFHNLRLPASEIPLCEGMWWIAAENVNEWQNLINSIFSVSIFGERPSEAQLMHDNRQRLITEYEIAHALVHRCLEKVALPYSWPWPGGPAGELYVP